MMGAHGTSVAFTQWPGAVEDWPEFGLMLGARGANHRISDERVFEYRHRRLTPDQPVLRGTAQNPDVFFAARETVNRVLPHRFRATAEQPAGRRLGHAGRVWSPAGPVHGKPPFFYKHALGP